MNQRILRYALIITLAGVLTSFAVSLMPAFALSLTPLLLMLALMLLMVALHYAYLRVTPQALPAEPVAEPVMARPALLILGPYAKKWFSAATPNESTRFSGHATWLLITEPHELTRCLRDISCHTPGTPIMAFFPFLPDGHETSALMVEKLLGWQRLFSGLMAHLHLPCVLAIYVQLSNERRHNAPQNATWIGTGEVRQRQTTDYATLMANLQSQLSARQSLTTHDAQRAVMGKQLIHWLRESGLDQTFTSLFASPPLQLNSVMLCDYGDGFSRHGAWSHWLEKKFALLPGLGQTMTLPPLPQVKVPLLNNAQPPHSAATSARPAAILWSSGLVALLLCAHIASTSWLIRQQQQLFRQQIQQSGALNALSVQTLQQRIRGMEQMQQAWSACLAVPALRHWGLSPCQNFVSQIEQRIALLKELPTLSSGTLFDSGSARLQSTATPFLNEAEALIKAWPQRNILIVGHSDNTGNDGFNHTLSVQRAERIRAWLVQQGIDISRLKTRAVGASEPVASNETAAGRQQNRRIEIVVLPSSHNERSF